jgi:hypothetical protein
MAETIFTTYFTKIVQIVSGDVTRNMSSYYFKIHNHLFQLAFQKNNQSNKLSIKVYK